ncbi:MAG: hypothetical protein OSB21_01675, partial [Myxococcota bacterium]|nr:hypothetical protein [Myxococcota bacterium]
SLAGGIAEVNGSPPQFIAGLAGINIMTNVSLWLEKLNLRKPLEPSGLCALWVKGSLRAAKGWSI